MRGNYTKISKLAEDIMEAMRYDQITVRVVDTGTQKVLRITSDDPHRARARPHDRSTFESIREEYYGDSGVKGENSNVLDISHPLTLSKLAEAFKKQDMLGKVHGFEELVQRPTKTVNEMLVEVPAR